MPIKQVVFVLALLVAIAVLVSGCGLTAPAPSDLETAAFNQLLAEHVNARDFSDITQQIMTGERQEKFKAVHRVYDTPQGDYAFISEPGGYNGPISLAVVIDKKTSTIRGMSILAHTESKDFVRDMESKWFTDRFKGKPAANYLSLARLEANRDNEIIAITGATVTTEAITNGVNACLGVYREAVLGQTAEAVPDAVHLTPKAGLDSLETGSLSIRASGEVRGTVTLDQIRAMPSVIRTMSIRSTTGTTTHRFRGTLLANVIAAADPTLLTRYSWVIPHGADDYMSQIAMSEVKAENSVFLMYEDNGNPLLTKDGKPAGMRVVVINDVFGQRFTNYLTEIALE